MFMYHCALTDMQCTLYLYVHFRLEQHVEMKNTENSSQVAESPVFDPEAPVVELVIAVGAVPLVVALPDVGDAEPAPAPELSARARQAVHSLVCNR